MLGAAVLAGVAVLLLVHSSLSRRARACESGAEMDLRRIVALDSLGLVYIGLGMG